ncbi:MAG: bifunctional glyoxylate/hydroxypyruvate reductase GhrA [Rhodobacteraceae bacterium HLUCCA08]|nr:MAG: bifunctional glyoxylate/hydroxypyruvate reductase GhrA [Rhodobacteraceae bacterium HLUCCA08]
MSTDRADPIRVLFAAPAGAWETYREALPRAFDAAGLDVELSRDIPPEAADYLVVTPKGPIRDFSPFTRARAVLNLWAGVEALVDNPTLTQPLVRMIDPGLTQGMVEWVTGHALRHHLNTDLHVTGQDGIWRSHVPPLAQDRPVTVLGLGELGAACAQALAALGFPVTGWSRGAKAIDGIRCLHGSAGLETALRGAQIVILLLPLTRLTHNLLNATRLAWLPKGAVVINPGRGPLIDDDALLAALDAGLGHATLDVFRTEPLPPDHPFWAHPKVTVTPHIASETRALSAARAVAANIARAEAGDRMDGLVDRDRGY